MALTIKFDDKRLRLTVIIILAGLMIGGLTYLTIHLLEQKMKADSFLKAPLALLLIGMDLNILTPQSHDDPTALPRTDTLILTIIDPRTSKIAMVSIPRDSLVYIPGYGEEKINDASVVGGFALTKKVVSQLSGTKIDRYMVVNFAGFKELVNLLGGVEINVDKRMRYADQYGAYTIKLNPGLQKLDGTKALQYVRFRNEPLGDISRVARQRKLLIAIFKKVKQPENIIKLPALLKLARKYIKTDLSTPEMIQLLKFSRKINLETGIFSYTLPGSFYEADWKPNPQQVRELMLKLKPASSSSNKEKTNAN